MKNLNFILALIFLLSFSKESKLLAQDTTYTEAFKDLPDTTQLRILVEFSDLCQVNEMPNYVNQALRIGRKLYEKNPKSYYVQYYAAAYNNEAFYYDRVGNIDGAIKSYLKSLKIREEDKDSLGMAESYNNLASIFHNQNDLKAALNYYGKAQEIFKLYKDTLGLTNVLINLGYVYYSDQKFDSSLYFFEMGLVLAEKTNDINAMGFALNNLSALYYKRGLYDQTEETYLRSLKLRELTGRKSSISSSHHNLGRFYLTRNNVQKALSHAKISYKLALEISSPEIQSDADLLLSDIYNEQKKFKKAHYHLISHMKMKDSILSDQTQKATLKQQMKYEYEHQKTIDDKEYEKQLAISAEQEKKQQVVIYAVIAGLILVIIFSIIIFNRLQVTRKQKLIIEDQKLKVEEAHFELGEKNTEILDSINYAKRIQDAILPSNDVVKELLTNSFIYYKPKDIIAGDFYWIDKIGDKVLFAAADCTGHGVPGAMMSVLCHNALSRSIREEGLIMPGEILTRTRGIVVEQLNKTTDVNDVSMDNIRDGMDIAFCVLDVKMNELYYAGAHNPLWILRKGAKEIEEIKSDKQSIGRIDNPQPYQSQKVQLNKGDSIYVFTDGYADQFGGEKGKKFKYKPFKNLIVSMKDDSMEEQLKLISSHFDAWKGRLEQVDDVCVIGVKI
jgi:serine phosphatase RsbU (regulator of sigma subunit)